LIQHVSLEVREGDADACAAFWALLGFAEVPAPGTLGERSRWLQRGTGQIHLLFTEEPVAPPQGHVAIVADDYDATLARLRDAGHEVEPHAEHWGAPRAFVVSPAGHRVEVMARAPV
jgi:catechol 2,3-dioxygenase-like lactoylglutathione lyase family enzyme